MISAKSQAKRRYVALAILSPLTILLVWTLLTAKGAVAPIILPSPAAVTASFLDMVQRGYSGVGIWTHIGASLARVGIAFFTGATLGIAIGLLRGRIAEIDALFLVPSEIVRPIPPLGLIPLFILWFGIGEMSKILLIFLSVFLIMMVNAQAGSRSCAVDALRAAQSMGAGRWQIFRFVVLPSGAAANHDGAARLHGHRADHSRRLRAARRRPRTGIHHSRRIELLPHDLRLCRHHSDRLHRACE
jgi:NitT/TauT family transport system permease protein/taurine transport system permease protein